MPRKKRIGWLLNAFPPTSKKKTIRQSPNVFISIFFFALQEKTLSNCSMLFLPHLGRRRWGGSPNIYFDFFLTL
jgi:hypothetical protein